MIFMLRIYSFYRYYPINNLLKLKNRFSLFLKSRIFVLHQFLSKGIKIKNCTVAYLCNCQHYVYKCIYKNIKQESKLIFQFNESYSCSVCFIEKRISLVTQKYNGVNNELNLQVDLVYLERRFR